MCSEWKTYGLMTAVCVPERVLLHLVAWILSPWLGVVWGLRLLPISLFDFHLFVGCPVGLVWCGESCPSGLALQCVCGSVVIHCIWVCLLLTHHTPLRCVWFCSNTLHLGVPALNSPHSIAVCVWVWFYVIHCIWVCLLLTNHTALRCVVLW